MSQDRSRRGLLGRGFTCRPLAGRTSPETRRTSGRASVSVPLARRGLRPRLGSEQRPREGYGLEVVLLIHDCRINRLRRCARLNSIPARLQSTERHCDPCHSSSEIRIPPIQPQGADRDLRVYAGSHRAADPEREVAILFTAAGHRAFGGGFAGANRNKGTRESGTRVRCD